MLSNARCLDDVNRILEILSDIWYASKQGTPNPFSNTGGQYDGEVFKVKAYDWSDREIPPEEDYNFAWRDIRVSWYKYLGRGMEINREMTTKELDDMLIECVNSMIRGQ